MRTALTRMIESDVELKVVGQAQNGVEALDMVASLNPDVITLDIEMPRLDGIGVLRRLMEENPKPVIMVSSLSQEGAEVTLQAFDLGAFECIPKQLSYASLDIIKIREQLVAKVKAAARYKPRRPKRPVPRKSTVIEAGAFSAFPKPEVVAIGTSTGGPGALREIIAGLPKDLPVGVLVVQHMPPGFTGPLAKRLDSLAQVRVFEAVNEQPIEPGHVLIAPAGFQMHAYRRSATKYSVRISREPNHTLHIPSVDETMLSVAEVFGGHSVGVILTGMGNDGAKGMRAIFEKGGITIGQDESSCVVYGMPRACAEMNVLRRVAPLANVSEEIIQAARRS
ncbi:MAG: chemotaxis response regulator protein-glutamate methylesterase [Acidobacteria bacterium]|nr:chemotaxis response regulator protein-glutamate methylesterase [Acidobacteriota bacterium]